MWYLLQMVKKVVVVSLIIGLMWLFEKVFPKKAGYRWRKILWLVLAVILLLPVSVGLRAVTEYVHGFEVSVEVPQQLLTKEEREEIAVEEKESQSVVLTEAESAKQPQNAAQGGMLAASGKVQHKTGNGISFVGGILAVWGVGAGILLALRCVQYQRMKKKYLAGSTLCEEPATVKCMERVCRELGIRKLVKIRKQKASCENSPMLIGYCPAVLLLPGNPYTEEELDAIMRHELAHYQAGDLWYKLLMVIVCDIYWFNPLFRLMKSMAFHDVECACDEKATRNMNLEAKKCYSSTMLKEMSGMKKRNLAFTTQFACTKKNAKKRFENIFQVHNRKIGIAALGLMLLVLVTGTACVSVEVAEQNPTATPVGEDVILTPETEEQPVTEEKKIITIDSSILPEESDALLAQLQEQYPDYEIVAESSSHSYREEEFFQQPPTVFWAAYGDVLTLAEEGKVADLTEALEKRGWLEQMDGVFRDMVSDDKGKVYGIPKAVPYAYGLVVNVEMFRAAGLVDESGVPIFPKTWEELAQTAAAIHDATGEAGICLIAGDYLGSAQFCNMAWNYGAVDFCSSKESDNLDSEAAIKAMQFIKDLRWKYDVLTEDPLQENYLTGYEHLVNGTAAMFIGANDSLDWLTSAGMKAENIAMGPMPAGPDGAQYAEYGGGVIAISADAKPEEIEIVLSLLEQMGLGPVLNDAAKERITGRIQAAAESGAPTIREIPVWNQAELLSYEQSVLADLGNVDQSLYEAYFEAALTPGYLKLEDIRYPSALYDELSTVLKKVVTDQEADVEALMKAANEKWLRCLETEE